MNPKKKSCKDCRYWIYAVNNEGICRYGAKVKNVLFNNYCKYFEKPKPEEKELIVDIKYDDIEGYILVNYEPEQMDKLFNIGILQTKKFILKEVK